VFNRVEARGGLLRLDPDVVPSMYRCATVTKAELTELRRIKKVLRKGRVTALDTDRIHLDDGSEPTNLQTLHIDCSADGLEKREATAVFDGNHITLQSVRTCQQVFSAAFIGHIEASYTDELNKNELCTPVPHPDTDIDFLRTALTNARNGARWAKDQALQAWLKAARLDGFTMADAPEHDMSDPEVAAQAKKLGDLAQASTENLQRLLAET